MIKRMTKMFGVSFALLATALVLTGVPTLAKSQPAADNQLVAPVALAQPPERNQPGVATAPAAASHTFELCATTGSITMPDSTIVPIWSFVETASCALNLATSLPGPELHVTAGDSVTINLTNALGVDTSLLFPGLANVEAIGSSGDSFTAEASSGGGTATYNFTVTTPGTYLYGSGTDVGKQMAMGLYGALIVEPAIPDYDTDAVLVLSEIDPDLNANPAGFDMLDYHPTYWLINGQAFPDTANIQALAGDTVLLRYLNAGATHHTMALLGLYQEITAKDAAVLPDPFEAIGETIPAGQTMEAMVEMPAGAAVGDTFALYSRQLNITNGGPGANHFLPGGGMMTYLEVSAPSTDLNVEVDSVVGGYAVASYGGAGQDVNATVTLEDGNNTLHIVGNGWKQVVLGRAINANTVLEFDFKSTVQGEVHGVGFDADDSLPPDVGFQLYGTENWAAGSVNHDFEDYAADAPNYKHYVIPVGQFYTGSGDLIFANDHDVASPTAEGFFSNIQIYDQLPPSTDLNVEVDGVVGGYAVASYGGAGQDVNATVTLEDGNNTLHIVGNGWKQVVLGRAINANTVLEFDFKSTVQGEIHGVGFDADDSLPPDVGFQLYGTENWGAASVNHDFEDYAADAPNYKHYAIPVGQFYTGSGDLFFANDHDVASPTAEGFFSNIQIYDLFYQEDFEGYSAGDNPTDWFDTAANNSMTQDDSLFQVFDISGNKVFGTTSTATNIHSHYVGAGSDTLSGYQYSGRMMISASGGGIGVTLLSDYANSDTYYRLRRYGISIPNNSFHLSPHGTSISGGTTDTGVTPVANVWYWFRMEVEDTGTQTNIRAKVWADGDPEPGSWQIDAYDDSVTRLTTGRFGVWSFNPGSKYWDDLTVK